MAKTFVAFLLDKSGSMGVVKDDTLGAFNKYVETLKGEDAPANEKADIVFSLVQFDSMGMEKTWTREPIEKVTKLTNDMYKPGAWTPLIDASYKTIKAVEEAVKDDPTAKVVICIQTDGMENASTQHSWDELNALIKERTAAGWQFNFMGVGLDAYNQGLRMGVQAANTMSYDVTSKAATMNAFMANASNTRAFAVGLASNTSYSANQRVSAGDIWDGTGVAPRGRNTPSKRDAKVQKRIILDDLKL